MVMAAALNQLERGTEHLADRGAIVPNHWKTATALRPVRCKGADDHMPARAHCLAHAPSLCGVVGWFDQEMKCRPVLPNIVALVWAPCRHVGDNP